VRDKGNICHAYANEWLAQFQLGVCNICIVGGPLLYAPWALSNIPWLHITVLAEMKRGTMRACLFRHILLRPHVAGFVLDLGINE
jgi:hypothetical protein